MNMFAILWLVRLITQWLPWIMYLCLYFALYLCLYLTLYLRIFILVADHSPCNTDGNCAISALWWNWHSPRCRSQLWLLDINRISLYYWISLDIIGYHWILSNYQILSYKISSWNWNSPRCRSQLWFCDFILFFEKGFLISDTLRLSDDQISALVYYI